MEGLPLRNLIAVIVMLFILYISVYVTNFFSYFIDRENLRNAVDGISKEMEMLASGSDFNSWSDLDIIVPEGAAIYINESSNCIETTDYNVNNRCVKYDINNSLSIANGIYNIRVFYGENSSAQEFMIIFR